MSFDLNLHNLEGHNADHVICTDYGTLSTDRFGLDTCTAVFKIKTSLWAQLPSINSPHPIFTYIGMEHRDLSFKNGWAIAECKYAGIDDGGGGPEGGTEPVYELVAGLSEEPVETHKDFVAIAGTADSPLNGAIFRHADGSKTVFRGGIGPNALPTAQRAVDFVFDSFATVLPNGTKNPKAKIEAYLEAASMTWRKTVYAVYGATPDASAAGKRDIPEGPAPTLPSGATWLNMGITYTKRGSAAQLVTEWRSSGRKGWDTDFYK